MRCNALLLVCRGSDRGGAGRRGRLEEMVEHCEREAEHREADIRERVSFIAFFFMFFFLILC